MKIFLAYPHAAKKVAEEVFYALLEYDHEVFWDEVNLKPGGQFNRPIREKLIEADLLVALVNRGALPQSYLRVEIDIRKNHWPNPAGRTLCCIIDDLEVPALPPYLRQGTVLRERHHVAAYIGDAIASWPASTSRGDSSTLSGVTLGTSYCGTWIEARAQRPITTAIELRVAGKLIASETRPLIASLAYGLRTLIGQRPVWRVTGECVFDKRVSMVGAEFVTTFWSQFFRIFVDSTSVVSERLK